MSGRDRPDQDGGEPATSEKAALPERVRGVLGNLIREARTWLATRTLPRFYYRHLYGPDGSVACVAGRVVRWWEERWGLYDAPMPRSTWEQDYERGQWDYMAEAREAPRYAVLAGYLRIFARGGRVLDVGCGPGLLLDHLAASDRGRYVGIDVSREAVERARGRGGPDDAFVVADAASFRPGAAFDAVVFNEVLYYLQEPLRQAARYADHLRSGGVVITSTYHGSPRALAILRRLAERWPPLVESTTSCGGNAWTCSVFRPER